MERPGVTRTPVANRGLAIVLVVCGLVALVVTLVAGITAGLSSFFAEEAVGPGAYVLIGAFVVGDAVVPILPSESVLNTASVMAADTGNLSIEWIIVAGALGAIIGDSLLYWIARLDLVRLKSKVDSLSENEKAAKALAILDNNTGMLIFFGRYLPGVRFVVNATCGMVGVPYPTFLKWSALAGLAWSTYTCLVSYWVGSMLTDRPLVSILVSGVISAAILGVVYWAAIRRERRHVPPEAPAPGEPPVR